MLLCVYDDRQTGDNNLLLPRHHTVRTRAITAAAAAAAVTRRDDARIAMRNTRELWQTLLCSLQRDDG